MSNTFKLPCGSIVTNNQTTYGTLENLYTIDLEKGLVCAKHFLEDMKITWSIEAVNMEFNFDIIPIYQVDAMDYFHSITKQPFVKPLDLLLLLTLSKDKYYIKRTRDFICSTLIPFINKNKIKHDDFKKETIMSKVTPIENHSQKFHSDLFGDLTVLTHADGSLWFIAKEIADLLEYANPSNMYAKIDDEDKQTCPLEFGGQVREVIIINESGLYAAVLGSKKPEAKEFKRWVTKDILPSIRKTGGYGQSSAALPNFADPAEAAIAWANQYKEKSALQLEVKQIETQITEDKPYTTLGKMMTMIDGTVKVGDYAIMLQNQHNLKIGQNRLFAWFREHGYLCKEERYKNRPTQKSMDQELFAWTQRMITTNGGVEVLTFTPRLTGKAQAYFLTKLLNDFTPETADKDRHEKDI